MTRIFASLEAGAILALEASDLKLKISLTRSLANQWRLRNLSRTSTPRRAVPEKPGRPSHPFLVPPSRVPKRKVNTQSGRLALIHAICHIELNAVDLALDIIARFARMRLPQSFFDDWMRVADEEAKHFSLLSERLLSLGSHYGAMAAHDGLWDSAKATESELTDRLALVPLVLEARGLDVTPPLIRALQAAGDPETAAIFSIIYHDEKGHVAVGAKWFRFMCRRDGVDPASHFQTVVRNKFRGALRPPFNDRARCASGITPAFYRSLSALGN